MYDKMTYMTDEPTSKKVKRGRPRSGQGVMLRPYANPDTMRKMELLYDYYQDSSVTHLFRRAIDALFLSLSPSGRTDQPIERPKTD